MSCFFSTFKSLLTAKIKEKINAEINSIYDCYNWSDISQMISLDHFETYDWDYAKFLNRKNMFEDLAKLSLNLWNDYEYYKRFTFQSRYEYRDYISGLVDLGYRRHLSDWNSQKKPTLLDVQSNIFMFSMYTSKCNNLNPKGDFQQNNETELIQEITRDNNVGEDKEIKSLKHHLSSDSEIIYKDFTFLMTVEIKKKINEKMNIIKDCYNWNNISQRIFLHRVETYDLNKEDFLKKNKIWEHLAKLSLNLWKDYEYYKQFTFQAKYDDEDYIGQLVNLGYECKDGGWESLKKPNLLDVQLNIFMYCMYMSMCNDIYVKEDIQQNNENELRQQLVFQDVKACGNNVVENIDIQPLQYPPSADDQLNLKDLTWKLIEHSLTYGLETEKDLQKNGTVCPICESLNTLKDKTCSICGSELNFIDNKESLMEIELSKLMWTCPSCTFINKLENKCCDACFTINILDESGENNEIKDTVDNEEVIVEMWNCPHCKETNSFNSYICKICHEYAPFFRKWRCWKCSYFNKEGSEICEVCLESKRSVKVSDEYRENGNEGNQENLDNNLQKCQRNKDLEDERDCAFCKEKCNDGDNLFCPKCTKKMWYCNNTFCCAINYRNTHFCGKCELKKGSNITKENMVEVYDGKTFVRMWQCADCGAFNNKMKCIKCNKSRADNIGDGSIVTEFRERPWDTSKLFWEQYKPRWPQF